MNPSDEPVETEVSDDEELEEVEGIEDIEETMEELDEEVPEDIAAEAIPEEEIIDERIYTVPLRKAYWTGSRMRRANKAVRILKTFVWRHMKPEELLIEPEVNEALWARGMQSPPRRIRIRATKNDENLVRVYLAEG